MTGSAGRVFVTAAPKVSPDEDVPQVRALRREAVINPSVPEFAADGRVRVVDWAFASRGAAWVEIGQLVPYLAVARQWAAYRNGHHGDRPGEAPGEDDVLGRSELE